jgi:competence protein ComEC
LSVLVRTAHHHLLFDMGPAVPEGFDAGERAVVPALRALGVRTLDAAVISHGDNDHAGGFDAVAAVFPMTRRYAPAGSGLDARIADLRECRAGTAWTWDGVRFRFLHPPPHFPYLRNESSCVLRVETAHGAFLLTGDIGEVVERDLLPRWCWSRITAATGPPIRASSRPPGRVSRRSPPVTATGSGIRSLRSSLCGAIAARGRP